MKFFKDFLPAASVLAAALLFSCTKEDPVEPPYVLQSKDIFIEIPEGGLNAVVAQELTVTVKSVSDDKVSYTWYVDEVLVAETKDLKYTFGEAGEYELLMKAAQGTAVYEYPAHLTVGFPDVAAPTEGATAYITKVFDYMPAVGQFTNTLPKYEEGDTQEDMNRKVLESIGNNMKRMITLGGYGGYVEVGFDHTIQNVEGKRDFRVLGNSFYANANPDLNAPEGGSCEPAIVQVAYDINQNGQPDENEWYEIAGSAHVDPTKELWYDKAVKAGNDVNIYFGYEITYYRPEKEPENHSEWSKYIRWDDNQGHRGYKVKNSFHAQPYFPLWYEGNELKFKGTCLPQNAVDESGQGNYYVLYKFRYGYGDNEINTKDDSCIDIDWAINSKGQRVKMKGIDFVRLYTGVNQENGWLGENSSEIMGVEDLHVLGKSIDTRTEL